MAPRSLRTELTTRFSVTIDSRLELVPVVADLARIACEGLGVRDVFAVELCLVEAVSNVIDHAYEGRAGNPVHVQFASSPGWLCIDVSDGGRQLPRARLEQARMPSAADPRDLPERGYGLALIKEVMERVEYETHDGTNTLTLLKAVA
jgi:serine/threonine-protein kinase RsbW